MPVCYSLKPIERNPYIVKTYLYLWEGHGGICINKDWVPDACCSFRKMGEEKEAIRESQTQQPLGESSRLLCLA